MRSITGTHHGRNIALLRQEKGIKQESLAIDIGVSQKTISRYERKKKLDDYIVEKIAKVLDVPADLITDMGEDPVMFKVENNTFETHDTAIGNVSYYQHPSNIETLLKENATLYERLLKSEQEKVALLQEVLKDKTTS